MSVDVDDWGLLTTVDKLADDPDVPATGTAIAEALGIPAHYADFIERRLQRNREQGFLDRDEHGHWHPTAAGLAATSITQPTGPHSAMLHVVRTRPEVEPALPDRLEDELVRSGARAAHLLADGSIAVTVAANTLDDAVTLVQNLIARTGAGMVETD